jgi:Flp pilus assembly protein TadG
LRKTNGFGNSRGQVTVELALVFALLLFLAMGIFEVARAILNVHQLTQAAREGARAASLTPALNTETGRQRVETRIQKVLQVMGKDLDTVQVIINPVDATGDGLPDLVDITLEEDFETIAPVAFIPGMDDMRLQATISMPLFMPQDGGGA